MVIWWDYNILYIYNILSGWCFFATPSEKWWSESQLGWWWHSQYMKVIKFLFQTTNQIWDYRVIVTMVIKTNRVETSTNQNTIYIYIMNNGLEQSWIQWRQKCPKTYSSRPSDLQGLAFPEGGSSPWNLSGHAFSALKYKTRVVTMNNSSQFHLRKRQGFLGKSLHMPTSACKNWK